MAMKNSWIRSHYCSHEASRLYWNFFIDNGFEIVLFKPVYGKPVLVYIKYVVLLKFFGSMHDQQCAKVKSSTWNDILLLIRGLN